MFARAQFFVPERKLWIPFAKSEHGVGQTRALLKPRGHPYQHRAISPAGQGPTVRCKPGVRQLIVERFRHKREKNLLVGGTAAPGRGEAPLGPLVVRAGRMYMKSVLEV